MPQVIGSGKIRKIVFDSGDWLGGLVPQYGGGSDPVVDLGLGKLSNATAFNPYRQFGCAAPGYSAQNPTNYSDVGAYLKKGVIDNGDIFATSHGDEIHSISIGTTPSVDNTGAWPHTITAHGGASGPVADDAVIYTGDQAGTDVRALYYSWSDDTSWDVGMYDLSSTFDDDWMQTAPASVLGSPYTTGGQGYPHPLEIGEDDIMYMGDRRFIHEYDGGIGTDGTVSEEVLKIPKGMVIRSFAKYPEFLVAFAYREAAAGASYYQGECKAYFWDYLSQDPTRVFDLNDNYVGEAFSYNGTVGVFTQGRTNDLEDGGNRNAKLQIFRGFGTGFTPEITFDDDIPERGGVFVNDQMIHWNSSGNHYTYGTPFRGDNFVLNKIARGASANTVSGMLMNPSTNFYLMSPSSAADGRLKYFGSGNYAEGTIFSTVNSTPSFSAGMMGRVKAVEIHFANTASGGRGLTMQLVNQAQENVTIASSLQTVTANTIIQEFKDPADSMRFSSIKLYGTYNTGSGGSDAPVVKKVVVYFEEVNIKKS